MEEQDRKQDLERYKIRIGLYKVIASATLISLFGAAFPFAQELAKSLFLKQIEEVKAAAQVTILDREANSRLEALQLEADLKLEAQEDIRVDASNQFHNNLAVEGRSDDIEKRIRLAEYFSFVSRTPAERDNWRDFREYLVEVRDRKVKERSDLRRIELDTSKNPIERQLASESIIMIDQQIEPSRLDRTKISYLDRLPYGAFGLDRKTVNANVSALESDRIRAVLGSPANKIEGSCGFPDNRFIIDQTVSRDLNGSEVTLLRPALMSLEEIFSDIAKTDPDLVRHIKISSSLCVRLVPNRNNVISNHSYGLAVNINLTDSESTEPGGELVSRASTIIAPYFKKHGWYWGAGFPNAEPNYFEVGSALFDTWVHEGKIVPAQLTAK